MILVLAFKFRSKLSIYIRIHKKLAITLTFPKRNADTSMKVQCNKYPSHFALAKLSFYLFGVLRRFQHCTGHIMTGSWKGRGNQYIQFVRVLYCKLPTNGKQLPAFPLEVVLGIEPRRQRWETRVLPLCHRGPLQNFQ